MRWFAHFILIKNKELIMAFDYQKDGQDILTVTMHMPGRSTNVINGSFLFALAHVLTWWLILFWLYRKKIFIKI